MRVKTVGRRQSIIQVAIQVFREVGFERATMAIISRRLGGSKATLYGYFKSKEELFETAMKAAIEGPGDQIMGLLELESADLRPLLERFAHAYLSFVLQKEVLKMVRTGIADGAHSSLGPHLFQQGPGRAIRKLTAFFEREIARGRIRAESPLIAALHFKGLIEAGFLEEALYGAEPETDKRTAISAAVDAFLRSHGPALPIRSSRKATATA